MIPEDFTRQEFGEAVADGVREALVSMMNDSSHFSLPVLVDSAIASGVRDAILEMMGAAGAYPVTRQEILNAIKEGAKERN